MINVTYKNLYESSAELMRQRTAINHRAEQISSIITVLSKYSGFDTQLKRLYAVSKSLTEQAYTIFCMGRALELSAKEYEKTDADAVQMSETYDRNKQIIRISEHRYLPNPSYISII